MQAIGNQVLVALSFPFLTFVGIISYYWADIKMYFHEQLNHQARIQQNQQERQRRQVIDENICCICLAQPKQNPVSSTCGHSYCVQCILQLVQHENQMVKCPLCRQQIHILFKLFESNAQTSEIQQKIIQYNRMFDDNRTFIRSIIQLPYVIKRLFIYTFSWNFVMFFLRNFYIIRFFIFMFLYILLPLDIFPESLLGLIGYIDDFLIIVFVLIILTANIAMRFYRGNN